jgi:hypothetical protein
MSVGCYYRMVRDQVISLHVHSKHRDVRLLYGSGLFDFFVLAAQIWYSHCNCQSHYSMMWFGCGLARVPSTQHESYCSF